MFKPMPMFVAVVTFVIVTKIMLKKSDNGYDKAVDEFMERETKANSTTKKFEDLNINFVKPCKDLPFKDYSDENLYKNLIKKQNMVKRKMKLEMIKIPQNLTNTELKETYGINNFEKISILEEHFNCYVRGLYEWAEQLYKIDNIEDCKKVLLEAIRLDANISHVYILLGEIYLKQNDKTSLINLKNKTENIELDLKQKVLDSLNNYINKL